METQAWTNELWGYPENKCSRLSKCPVEVPLTRASECAEKSKDTGRVSKGNEVRKKVPRDEVLTKRKKLSDTGPCGWL